MKRPIEWHEECLRNQRDELERAQHRLALAVESERRARADVDLRERQIAEAKRRGMDAFDSEKLLIKRR